MTALQKITLRQSEKRQAINTLLAKGEDLTTEDRAELDKLTKEMTAIEVEYRAALVADQDFQQKALGEFSQSLDDGEGAEVRALKNKAHLSSYMKCAADGTPVSGAESELNQALKVNGVGGVAVPWVMLAEDRQVEMRADAVTNTSALDGGVTQRPILQRIFGPGIMDFMGVRIDGVPSGMSEWPLMTGGVDPDQKQESAVKDAEAATFTTQSLKPKRLTARYLYTYEQGAQIPAIEAVFRNDLAQAIKAEMSAQVINGNGSNPNVTGFLQRLTAPANPSTVATYTDFLTGIGKAVDGLHATREDEISMLLGVETYQLAVSLTRDGVLEHATQAIRKYRVVLWLPFICLILRLTSRAH